VKKAALLTDDRETTLIVETALECAGFHCETYGSMLNLMRGTKRDEHAVLIIDVSLDEADCAALLDWRRNWLGQEVAIIAVGADHALSAARYLELGVDDFIAKPVRGAEVLARVSAALRRKRPEVPAPRHTLAGCSIDRSSSAILAGASRVPLTARELAIAEVLFDNAGQLVTRSRLARDVWGQCPEISGHAIEQHIYQLRRKLKRCVGEAIALRGVYGSGYRIDIDSSLLGSAESASGVTSEDVSARLARAKQASALAQQAIENASG
jgi:DNA-binding response OmpR family regulator